MKIKSLLFIPLAVLFLACNEQTQSSEKANTQDTEHHSVHGQSLVLNNGKKWKADATTHQHLAVLKATVENYSLSDTTSLNTYHSKAQDLQGELNQLIADCKMKGKDHEALHLWLEPIIKNVASIHKATTADAAKEPMQQVIHSIHQFDQYFE